MTSHPLPDLRTCCALKGNGEVCGNNLRDTCLKYCGTHKNYIEFEINQETGEFQGEFVRRGGEKKAYTNVVEFNIKALREMQQKRTMEFSPVKIFKRMCKKGKFYICPRCKQSKTSPLQNAHVGKQIIVAIREIVNEHGERLNWNTFELFKLVQEVEDKSQYVICCSKCNTLLEEK